MIKVHFYDYGNSELDIEEELGLKIDVEDFLMANISDLSLEAGTAQRPHHPRGGRGRALCRNVRRVPPPGAGARLPGRAARRRCGGGEGERPGGADGAEGISRTRGSPRGPDLKEGFISSSRKQEFQG